MQSIPSFLISATASGSGKTTMTLGLLRAMKNRELKCQPFKCGPDYIDTKYHDIASGNPSINLDLFLSSSFHVKYLYSKYASNADVCITEGVMGLFDGYDRMKGSSAEIAEQLNIPVILVINAKSMAYSAAAMLYGFKNFDKKINVVGVIFNFVASESHYQYLKEACEDIGLEALGYLPKNANIEIPSRHLGLSLDKEFCFDDFADNVAELVEKHIDIDRLLDITKNNITIQETQQQVINRTRKLKISVAYDDAFNFMYHENIEYLKRLGTVTFFSPLVDKELPSSDFVYLPGGYPELYLTELSNNKTMLNSLHDYIENGGKLLAECGGMMYLCSNIIDKEGNKYPMVNILKQDATMEAMKLKLGYRYFIHNHTEVKGHEFHYSSIRDIDNTKTSSAQIFNAKKKEIDTKLFRYKNMLAGYTHLYWAEIDLMKLFE